MKGNKLLFTPTFFSNTYFRGKLFDNFCFCLLVITSVNQKI